MGITSFRVIFHAFIQLIYIWRIAAMHKGWHTWIDTTQSLQASQQNATLHQHHFGPPACSIDSRSRSGSPAANYTYIAVI